MKIKIDGYDINYIDEGKGDLIVLLHGWGANLKCFSSLINLVKSKYRVVALDLPGFGESDELKRSFSVSDFADIVSDFIIEILKDSEKKVLENPVILVGHSYGGRIILKLNSRDNLKFKITKNIMIDAAGIKDRKDLKTKLKIFAFKTAKNFINFVPLTKSEKDDMIAELRGKFGSKDYSTAPKVLQDTLVKSVNEDLTPLLPSMKETLLIWGKNDTATPLWMAKLMDAKIKNAGLVTLNGGHFSYLDDPITFSKVIASYLNL